LPYLHSSITLFSRLHCPRFHTALRVSPSSYKIYPLHLIGNGRIVKNVQRFSLVRPSSPLNSLFRIVSTVFTYKTDSQYLHRSTLPHPSSAFSLVASRLPMTTIHTPVRFVSCKRKLILIFSTGSDRLKSSRLRAKNVLFSPETISYLGGRGICTRYRSAAGRLT